MSCTACDAVTQLGPKHTCPGGVAGTMNRRLALAAAALPQIIARSPVHMLHAGEFQAPVLEAVCRQSFAIADAMLRAEGGRDPVHVVAGELLRVLKIIRHAADHMPARMSIEVPVVDRAIAAAAAAGVSHE